MKWNTVDEFEYSWCNDNCGYEMQLLLQEKDGSYRLKLTNETNIIGCIILGLSGVPSGPDLNERSENLPLRIARDTFEGDGYGNDLRDIARALGFQFVDPKPGGYLDEEPDVD